MTGDVHDGAVHYEVLCRTHYRLGQLGVADSQKKAAQSS